MALPLIPSSTKEGDGCPSCDGGLLMESADGRPYVLCDDCGQEFEKPLPEGDES